MGLETKTKGIDSMLGVLWQKRRIAVGLFIGADLLTGLLALKAQEPKALPAKRVLEAQAPSTTSTSAKPRAVQPLTTTTMTLPIPTPAPELSQIVERINRPETPISIEEDPDEINREDQLFISPDGTECAVQFGFVAAAAGIEVQADKFGPTKEVTNEKTHTEDVMEGSSVHHPEGSYETSVVATVDHAVDYAAKVSHDLCGRFVPVAEVSTESAG